MQNRHGFGRTVALPFDTAVERTTAALAAEGFGILTEIDVQATLEKKLGVARPRQRILGACNPPLAAKALDAEASIGLLMPCNVVVREDAGGQVHVEMLDPIARFGLTGRADVEPLAREVRARLDRALAAV